METLICAGLYDPTSPRRGWEVVVSSFYNLFQQFQDQETAFILVSASLTQIMAL